jgi:hypothetical protein
VPVTVLVQSFVAATRQRVGLKPIFVRIAMGQNCFEPIDAEFDEIAPAVIFHSRYFPTLEAISVRSEGAIRSALDQAACNGAARAKIR